MSQIQEDVSVIVCAYTEKRWHELCEAVASVQQQTVQPREIIVVIDHNPVLLQQAQAHLISAVVVENEEAKGASGSRNSGVAIAQGTIVVFLDDDAIADPHWIEQLLLAYSDPTVAGIGGTIEPRWLVKRPRWFPDEFLWVVGCSYKGLPTQHIPVRNVIGANMSVRKYALVTVGGFRESFGNNKGTKNANNKWLRHQAGDEETELCIRVTRQLPGLRWFYMPSAIVLHSVPAQRTQFPYFLWRCYDEGLGKALLTALHDKQIGLSSERAYTFQTLPEGIVQGLTDTFFRRDITGLARAGAIIVGLLVTTAGYIMGGVFVKAMNREKHRGVTEASLLQPTHL